MSNLEQSKVTRDVVMKRLERAHEQLSDWRAIRKQLFNTYCKETIPRVYGDLEVEPDGSGDG